MGTFKRATIFEGVGQFLRHRNEDENPGNAKHQLGLFFRGGIRSEMLTTDSIVFLLVDVQGKLAQVMSDKESLFENLQKLVQGIRLLEVPVLWMEQNPRGLGRTIPELVELLPDMDPMSKMSFSCCGNASFVQQLEMLQRKQVVIAGIETHVCVYQTTMDLLSHGYGVHVVADAVSSRSAENKRIGLEAMRDLGARWTSTEMVLFELMQVAGGDKFKDMLRIVR